MTLFLRQLKIVVLIAGCTLAGVKLRAQDFEKIDSLKRLLKHDSNRVAILFAINKEFYQSNKDSSLHYANESLRISFKNADSLGIIRSLHARGDIKVQQGEVLKGINDLEIALGIANRNGFIDRSKFILNVLALAHTSIANYDEALDYNLQSLKIREEAGSALEISVAENNIGIVYLSLGDYEHALHYFERSLRTKLENKIEYDVARCYTNIGLTAIELLDFSKAIDNLNLAFKNCEENCDSKILMEAHFALGKAYLETKELTKSVI